MQMENGTYKAKAIGGGLGETSKGAEQVAVEFSLLDEGFNGWRITWFGFFTEKTTESTIRALRTCGWQGTDLTDLTGIDTNEVLLVIENETYDGKTSPKVRWVNPLGGGLALKNPMAPDKAKAFAARMRAQIAAVDATSGQRRTSTKPAGMNTNEPPPHTDNDMPF